LPHPPYSPDLAPSDFFLFGYIKEKLTDYDYRTREELKSAIIEICNEISDDVLINVFHSWLKRVKWVIRHAGSTTTSSQKIEDHPWKLREKKAGYELMDLPIQRICEDDTGGILYC
jgi:hypothetical protein